MEQNNRRLTDISPHGEQSQYEAQEKGQYVVRSLEAKKGNGLKKTGFILFAVLCIGALGAGAAHAFFSKAEITLLPEAREISVDLPLTVSVEVFEVEEHSKAIPGRAYVETTEATRLFQGTGTAVQEEKAEGVIRVYNTYTATALPLVAQTRFMSEEGMLFRAPNRIVVPGFRREGGEVVPGIVDVPVVAAEAGEGYNIEPSNFSLPGLAGSALYTLIYGESLKSMTGGTREEIRVVTAEDIERAREELLGDLRVLAAKRMERQLPEGYIVDPVSFALEVEKASTAVEPGAELKEFTYTARAAITGIAFRMEDVRSVVAEFLRTELNGGERIGGEVRVSYEPGIGDPETQTLVLRAHGETKGYAEMDEEALRLRILGKEVLEAERILARDPSVFQASVSLWPFWKQRIPRTPERIKFMAGDPG
ncbi:MAG: hypothetical protein ABIB12_01675 [Patescibacteria group bacterium]